MPISTPALLVHSAGQTFQRGTIERRDVGPHVAVAAEVGDHPPGAGRRPEAAAPAAAADVEHTAVEVVGNRLQIGVDALASVRHAEIGVEPRLHAGLAARPS